VSINKPDHTPTVGFPGREYSSDLHDALGYETKVGAEASYDEWVSAYQETVSRVARISRTLSLIGTQWRGATNADVVSWRGALMTLPADKMFQAVVREDVPIADRTGGEIHFASGVLAALLKAKTSRRQCSGSSPRHAGSGNPGRHLDGDEKLVISEVKRATVKRGVRATR